MSTTCFANVEIAPPIEVFNLTKLYNEDQSPNKVNLGVGGILRSVFNLWECQC